MTTDVEWLRRGSRKRVVLQPGEEEALDLVVDFARHEVLHRGRPVTLSATEYRLLHHLCATPATCSRMKRFSRAGTRVY